MTKILLYLFLLLAVVFIARGIRIIPQQTVDIVERLGKYYRSLEAGVNFVVPFIDRIRVRHDLRMKQEVIPSQSVITRDNVAVGVELATFYTVMDPKLATYSIANYVLGIHNIVASALRSTIGKMELDEVFSSREKIQAELRQSLDDASERWGVRIDRVEILELSIPQDIQVSMEKQMRAEREKRASVLQAEGEKQATVLRAEAQQTAVILKAEAEKKSRELEAAGQAEAIRLVAEAEKMRIEAIKAAGLDANILTYKSFEAISDMANGTSNTVFLPTDIAASLGSIGAMSKMLQK